MKNTPVVLCTAIFLLFSSTLFCQLGIVSGVLSDDDGYPLIGASILIKGTTNGTVTDIDGRYKITCNVGDILVFSYTGYGQNEVEVTPEMFGVDAEKVEKITTAPVKILTSEAYAKVLKDIPRKEPAVPSMRDADRTLINGRYYIPYGSIQNIDVKKNKVELFYFPPKIFYEASLNSTFGVQFMNKSNLPDLQNSFSQGTPVAGSLAFQGPETANVFSYGPSLNSLEFNGQDYIYDLNGQLVNQGSGNGTPANNYSNALLETVIKHSNNFNLNLSTNKEFLAVNFFNQISRDIYNEEQRSQNKISLTYNNNRNWGFSWKPFITYQNIKDQQPNINGFQNNLLLNLWATPASFSNDQGSQLTNGAQRSFSTAFNHPNWLLNNNRNAITEQRLVSGVNNNIFITEEIRLENRLAYNYHQQEQGFGLVNGTAGFEEGFSSEKQIENQSFNAAINFSYDPYVYSDEINIRSNIHYRYENLGFSFRESSGFDPFSFEGAQNNLASVHNKSRNVLKLLNNVKYVLDQTWTFQLGNNSYYSSLQNNKWFLPAASFKLNLVKLLDLRQVDELSVFSSASLDVNDTPLYYNNLSHNSLLISPDESLSYTSNNDLFINSSLDLEEKENYEVGANFSMYHPSAFTSFKFVYFHSTTKGSVFPILNNGNFELSNVADIRNQGFELSMDAKIDITSNLSYFPTITFSNYRTRVLKILDNEGPVPIAGFSDVSKNLVEGEPAGVIIGSAYLRDAQNNLVIDDNGFPMLNPIPQIIGDPIPDFSIGFNNRFKWEGLEFQFTIDIQKGGDLWNGTQNVLNYLGRSQQSAEERGINNYIFPGVDQNGNPNTLSVDFYDPTQPISSNRFVRYGFAGVAEDAIVDASYINLKSIDFSYTFLTDNDRLIRQCRLGIYAKNLYTWSNFRGHNPYGSLFGNSIGQELHFFNTPLLSELGFNIHLKL